MAKSTKKSTASPVAPEIPEGAELIPAGKGFLVKGGGVSANAMGFKRVDAGVCPKCETAAPPWVPPIEDFRYMNRIETLKETNGVTDDHEAHTLHLKQQGGFICECVKCGTSFWVPFAVAKVKE